MCTQPPIEVTQVMSTAAVTAGLCAGREQPAASTQQSFPYNPGLPDTKQRTRERKRQREQDRRQLGAGAGAGQGAGQQDSWSWNTSGGEH